LQTERVGCHKRNHHVIRSATVCRQAFLWVGSVMCLHSLFHYSVSDCCGHPKSLTVGRRVKMVCQTAFSMFCSSVTYHPKVVHCKNPPVALSQNLVLVLQHRHSQNIPVAPTTANSATTKSAKSGRHTFWGGGLVDPPINSRITFVGRSQYNRYNIYIYVLTQICS
jgi:hypothetical protein